MLRQVNERILLIIVCPFVLLLLAIVLSVLLRFTDSDNLFGIFKLFLKMENKKVDIEVSEHDTFLE
jgi:hypothetical protein